jgi:ATP-dependent DNA ligase
MEYGNGKYSNYLGNLIVRWAPHSNMKYTGLFNVGGGLTDDERKNWKNLFPKGTILTIRYMVLQPSGKPREPRFLKFYET